MAFGYSVVTNISVRLRFVGIQYNDTVTYFCIPAEPLSLSPSSALFLYLGLRELVDVSTKTRSLLQYIHGSFDDDGVPFTSTSLCVASAVGSSFLHCLIQASRKHACFFEFKYILRSRVELEFYEDVLVPE